MKKHQIPSDELSMVNIKETEIRTKPAKGESKVH